MAVPTIEVTEVLGYPGHTNTTTEEFVLERLHLRSRLPPWIVGGNGKGSQRDSVQQRGTGIRQRSTPEAASSEPRQPSSRKEGATSSTGQDSSSF
ncbi:hypothetical protein SKAU_G00191940 [Synaphobranchus kaupii]|uniref:Uncharacterized protein n=1 Tax=Synaphobranchus kaupii TaxID=118154 RepID=A0A9Q1FDL5_SYNKA|nr:hypothetical protein SKAU_G00191940 [Synaphobranchus kaupii]